MNPDHAHFADWDAAYVLGALSPSDRRAFEAHIQTCERCRVAIAEIAPTIGLLARVDRTRAESLVAGGGEHVDAGPEASLRGAIVARARFAARRRRGWWIGSLAAAAAVLAVVLAFTITIAPDARGIRVLALESVSDAPLSASVELGEAAWGTRIELECRYDAVPGGEAPAEGWPYTLYVVGEDGAASPVSSWRASPGSTARVDAGTDLEVGEIASIEIRSLDGEDVFMRVDVDSAGG